MRDNMELPVSIDDYIVKGMRRGKNRKNHMLVKRTAGIAACMALVLFIVGVRVSPVFAAGAAKIPGLKYIVELVQYDEGLTSAINNDYIQHIGRSDEKQGIVLTVDDIIADNSGIIVFYSIENNSNYKSPHISNVKLLDSSGKDLKIGSTYGLSPSQEKVYHGRIDFNTDNEADGVLPESVILKTDIAVDAGVSGEETAGRISGEQSGSNFVRDSFKVLKDTWNVPVEIDRAKFTGEVKEYEINQEVQVENQKIIFKNIKIYPTKCVLSVSFDKNNTMQLFTLEDLKLADETGREWGKASSGIVSFNPDENSRLLIFQSNYFYNPKKLYITGGSIRALDKDKCYFTLDTENKKITYSPFDILSLTDFKLENGALFFEANVKKGTGDTQNHFGISYEALDANGTRLEVTGSGTATSSEANYISYNLKLAPGFKGPITFKIYDYPNWIKGNFRVEVPLKR